MKAFSRQGKLTEEATDEIELGNDEEDIAAASIYTQETAQFNESFLKTVEKDVEVVVIQELGMPRVKERKEGADMLTKVCCRLLS